MANPPPPDGCGDRRARLWAMCPVMMAGMPVKIEQPTNDSKPNTRLAMARALDGDGLDEDRMGGGVEPEPAPCLRPAAAALAAKAAPNSGNPASGFHSLLPSACTGVSRVTRPSAIHCRI